MAYMDDHDIYCDSSEPTQNCARCESEAEQTQIEAEKEAALEFDSKAQVVRMSDKTIVTLSNGYRIAFSPREHLTNEQYVRQAQECLRSDVEDAEKEAGYDAF